MKTLAFLVFAILFSVRAYAIDFSPFSKKEEAPAFAQASGCDANLDHLGRDLLMGIHLGANESEVWCAIQNFQFGGQGGVAIAWNSNSITEFQRRAFPGRPRQVDSIAASDLPKFPTFSTVLPKTSLFNGKGNIPSLYTKLDTQDASENVFDRQIIRLVDIRSDLPDVYYFREFCPYLTASNILIGKTSYSIEISFDQGRNSVFNYAPLASRLDKGIKPASLGLYKNLPVYSSCEVASINVTIDKGSDNEIKAATDAEAIIKNVLKKYERPEIDFSVPQKVYEFTDSSSKAHVFVRLRLQQTVNGVSVADMIFRRRDSAFVDLMKNEELKFKNSVQTTAPSDLKL